MKISFVVPAYNEEALLGKCLESIQQAIAVARCNAEIIVVNNASTDRTGEIARSYAGVRVVDEPQKGLTHARHAGYMAATGDIIANVDADTILTPEWLPTVLVEFSRHDDLVALSGPFIYYDLPLLDRTLVQAFYGVGFGMYVLNHYILNLGSMLQGGNYVVRRDALEEIGGFDRTIEFYGEDTDIARRISKVGRVKWTFSLSILASGRRLKKEGILTMGIRYAANYLSTTYRGVPFTRKYVDIRLD